MWAGSPLRGPLLEAQTEPRAALSPMAPHNVNSHQVQRKYEDDDSESLTHVVTRVLINALNGRSLSSLTGMPH